MNVPNPTILLVEDNPDDVLLTLRALNKNHIGNEVFVVEDGAEALDYLFAQSKFAHRSPDDLPQMVLLDLKLPKLDGMEVLRRIRSNPRTARLPVVMLTSSDQEKYMTESYEMGANVFMHKPVDFDQLISVVTQLGISWMIVNSKLGQ